jgi:hypothetical protein
VIAHGDTTVTDQIVALVYIVVGLIVVVVAILVVIAWFSSLVARLLDWRRRGHWERRR